ncbi:hypothetical protein Tco_0308116 [Tanacetum coccineum]
MSDLKFDDSHNMVAFLEKPVECEGFEQIATAKEKTVNGEEQLQALVERKNVIITESTIRRDLYLEDGEEPGGSRSRIYKVFWCRIYEGKEIHIGTNLGMTPTQALTAIQTMAGHSKKWHDGTSSRNVSSNNNTDGLAAIISKLDNLGRDMKKLKENVHAIQVGCQIYEGPHLDKEFPPNEEVKQVDEVKYGKFGRLAPFNECSRAKFCVGPLGYYTHTDNQTSFGEKKPNLVETINKSMEEASKRQAEQDEWLKTF